MKKLLTFLLAIGLFALLPACKSKAKDADIKEAVDMVLAAHPDYNGLSSSVTDGTVNLTGEVKDESTRSSLTTAVSEVKGVKSVQNNTSIAPPPPPVATEAPVISPDEALTKGVVDALKDHPTVQATVNNGVVTVTGEATPANRDKIKMSLDALHPKKVDLKGLKILR